MGGFLSKKRAALSLAAAFALLCGMATPAYAEASVNNYAQLNEYARWAINVPSSVLVASSNTTWQQAAAANLNHFDFALTAPSYAAVAGNSTTAPAPPG